ncbi:MAG: hypothetical protein R3C10_06260 [Pirellulales bacterium]
MLVKLMKFDSAMERSLPRWRTTLVVGTLLAVVCATAPTHVAAQADEANSAAANDPASAPVQPVVADPVVTALLETNPQTPQELIETVLILIDLKHPEAAGPLLQRVIDANLDEAALADLGRRFTDSQWLRLAQTAELHPAAVDFTKAVWEASDRRARQPERVSDLVEAIKSDEVEIWYPAANELARAGIDGIAALIAVLADPAAADAHPAVIRALVTQGQPIVPQLVAYAERGDPVLNEQLARVFSQVPDPMARPVLLAIAFANTSSEPAREYAKLALQRLGESELTVDYALAELIKEAERHLNSQRPFGMEDVENVETWRWNAELGRPQLVQVPYEQSSAILAGLRAQQALAVAPDSDEAAQLLLTAALETSALLGASDQQKAGIEKLAEQLGTDIVEAAMVRALATRRTAAAIGAIGLLARSGDADLLSRSAPSLSPLAKATMDANPEVRLAALEAVVALAPQGGFVGASFVPAGLTYFTRALGAQQAIVADPRPAEATRVASLLAGLGYDVEVAHSLGELSQMATSHPDCELVLLAVIPSSRFTPSALERLRRDHRTAETPVALVTAALDLPQAEALADGDLLAEVMVRPVDEAGLASQLESVGRPLTEGVLPAEVRRQQAVQAMQLLAQLAEAPAGGYPLADIERAVELACYDSELSPSACMVLARLAVPTAQQQLVDLASNDALPIDLRKAAAAAFVDSVERYGIMLTSQQMLVQYARYNASQYKDAATQQILGAILDCLEGESKTALNDAP